MEIRLLGNVELHEIKPAHAKESEQPAVRLARSAERCVLATLAFSAGRHVSASALIDNIGPTRRGGYTAPSTLNGYVRTIRAAIIRADGNRTDLRTVSRSRSYILDIPTDTVDYLRLRAQAHTARETGDFTTLAYTLKNWPAEALSDVDSMWAQTRRHALDAERLDLYQHLLHHQLVTGNPAQVLDSVNMLAEEHTPTDTILLLGARALAATGRHGNIHTWIGHGARRMRETLGVDPSRSLYATVNQLVARPDTALNPTDGLAPATTPTRDTATRPGQPAKRPAAMFTVPGDLPEFTGRDDELNILVDTVNAAARTGVGAVAIHAIDGMAGVGKTAFSVHAAHRLSGQFPDGLMFHQLHGNTPGKQPAAPSEALFSLLAATGMAPLAIADSLDDRARQWRDRMAGKKVLLILDDAASHDQIRPLLLGTPGSLVIITSRTRLAALDGVHQLSLGVLKADQAATMFIRLARLSESYDRTAVSHVAELCGYLPLAIALVAGRLRNHSTWTPSHLVAALSETRENLDHFAIGDRSVRAAFDISYDQLPSRLQHTYVLAGGVHPGPEIDAYALAALAEQSLADSKRDLEVLHTDHLIQEISPGRYRFHDLLRAYAKTQAAVIGKITYHQALQRVLDYYLYTANDARRYMPRYHTPTSSVTIRPPAHQRLVGNLSEARHWLDMELITLENCVQNTRTTHPEHTLALSATLHPYLRLSLSLDHADRIHCAALATSQNMENERAQAATLHEIGIIQYLRCLYDRSEQALTDAERIYSNLGDRLGQGNTLYDLGRVYRVQGHYERAEQVLTEAEQLFTGLGDHLGRANVYNYLGILCRLRCQYGRAEQLLNQAKRLYIELGNLRGQGATFNELGIVYRLRGQHEQASQILDQAMQVFANLGDERGQANITYDLGVVFRLRGQYEQAEQMLNQARRLFAAFGDQRGQANPLYDLGVVFRLGGEYERAEQVLSEAGQLYANLGYKRGYAYTLSALGTVYRLQGGRDQKALDCITQAYTLTREVGDLSGEAEVLISLGNLAMDYSSAGDPHVNFTQARNIARNIGDVPHEAHALCGIALCAHRDNKIAVAVAAYRAALTAFQQLDDPEADAVAAKLAALEAG